MPSGNFTKQWIKVKCANCDKEIELTQGKYDSRIKRVKDGKLFCSSQCRTGYRSKQDVRETKLVCHKCGKDFTGDIHKYEYVRRVKTLQHVGRVFCSRECSIIFADTDPEIRKLVAEKERLVSTPQRGRVGHILSQETKDKIAESHLNPRSVKLELKCNNCGKIFHRMRWIHNMLTERSKGRGPFCSPKCALTNRPMSEETRKILSEKQSGTLRPYATHHRPISEETKLKISESKTGISVVPDWNIVETEAKRRGWTKYALMKAPIPDAVTMENGKMVALELQKTRWETSAKAKTKSYENFQGKWDKVIIVWYTPDGVRRKEWVLENGNWSLVTN